MTLQILVVDDEKTLCRNIGRYLENEGYQAACCFDLREAFERMKRTLFDVVISDLVLPDGDGITLLEQTPALAPDAVFLLMTGNASLDNAIESFRKGTCDYLVKPFSLSELGRRITGIARYRRLVRENRMLRDEIQQCDPSQGLLVGRSPAIRSVLSLIRKVAATPSTVLITGESGTGKELIAQALHQYSDRRDKPFVPLNMAALPDDLVESHLFGHVRGAFTGADKAREGAFRTASEGTLFLDEIGELSLRNQSKLLRVLEDQVVLPVGSDIPITTDARLIVATNSDLEEMIAGGDFRKDLFYRLNVFTIPAPPLRERVEDIPLLVDHLRNRLRKKLDRPVTGVDPEFTKCLMLHSWPGNIRELANVIERAMLLSEQTTLRVEDLPIELQGRRERRSWQLEAAVDRFKHQHIAAVLEQVDFNREQAARLLGLSPATLYRQMGKLRLKGFRGLPDPKS